MKKRLIAMPTIAAIAATRGMLGVGAGLLAAPRISRKRRKAVGWTLLGIGVASTIPLAMQLFRRE